MAKSVFELRGNDVTLPRFVRRHLLLILAFAALALPASAIPAGDANNRLLGRTVWPANGEVTSPFGPRRGRMHQGVDIGMLRSLGIRSASAGTVTAVGYLNGYAGYGNVVLVKHRGYRLLYAHLSRVYVRKGQRVRVGQRLGLAGCTGSCTDTHLHFEVRRGGARMNPMRYLP